MHDNIYTWYNNAEESKLWRPALEHITFLKEDNTMSENMNSSCTPEHPAPRQPFG